MPKAVFPGPVCLLLNPITYSISQEGDFQSCWRLLAWLTGCKSFPRGYSNERGSGVCHVWMRWVACWVAVCGSVFIPLSSTSWLLFILLSVGYSHECGGFENGMKDTHHHERLSEIVRSSLWLVVSDWLVIPKLVYMERMQASREVGTDRQRMNPHATKTTSRRVYSHCSSLIYAISIFAWAFHPQSAHSWGAKQPAGGFSQRDCCPY